MLSDGGIALISILNRVMQQGGDWLIFCTSVLLDQAAHSNQVGDVGHRFSLAGLVAVQLGSPEQGLGVALTLGGGAFRHRLDLLRVQQRVLVLAVDCSFCDFWKDRPALRPPSLLPGGLNVNFFQPPTIKLTEGPKGISESS